MIKFIMFLVINILIGLVYLFIKTGKQSEDKHAKKIRALEAELLKEKEKNKNNDLKD